MLTLRSIKVNLSSWDKLIKVFASSKVKGESNNNLLNEMVESAIKVSKHVKRSEIIGFMRDSIEAGIENKIKKEK